MKKTGLVLAATAAALFVAGCATEADTSANSVQPAPVVAQPEASCKGMSSCKAKVVKKHHAKKHHATSTTETTTTTTTDAAAQQ